MPAASGLGWVANAKAGLTLSIAPHTDAPAMIPTMARRKVTLARPRTHAFWQRGLRRRSQPAPDACGRYRGR